jgi:hypothetical protein
LRRPCHVESTEGASSVGKGAGGVAAERGRTTELGGVVFAGAKDTEFTSELCFDRGKLVSLPAALSRFGGSGL